MRSKVVLTFQDNENNIISGAFRVCGIFKTQFSKYDENHVFIQNSDLHRLIQSEGYHQAALLCYSIDQVESVLNRLNSQLKGVYIKEIMPFKKMAINPLPFYKKSYLKIFFYVKSFLLILITFLVTSLLVYNISKKIFHLKD